MYREYRDVTLNNAIDTLYNDMAGRHRARNKSIQIIRTAAVPAKDCKRASTIQFHNSKLRFPLPHRILRPASKQLRSVFAALRPNTHFQ
jgi:large subunit ribosomal protein L18Ae